MPTTEYNIDMIKRRAPKETSEQIMDILSEIQLIVYSQDCLQTTKLTSNGMPPYLVTTQGTYRYDCPSDCRRTAALFTQYLPRGYNRQRPIGPRKEYYFRGKGYSLLSAETRDATISNVGEIYFQEDPGTTTEKYYHLYYLKPTLITDISIQLSLPEETHYLLREAVISMITSDEYGKSAFDESIMQKVARKIRNSLNRGYDGNTGKTPVMQEYQEYDNSRSYW